MCGARITLRPYREDGFLLRRIFPNLADSDMLWWCTHFRLRWKSGREAAPVLHFGVEESGVGLPVELLNNLAGRILWRAEPMYIHADTSHRTSSDLKRRRRP
jgi:hypothetical protein